MTETAADDDIDRILAAHKDRAGPLLPILHDIHAAFGHIPAEVVPRIAEALNIGRAEVHGVVSFYHDFRSAPAGRRVLRVCRAEACQAQGGAALEEAAQALLGLGWGETAADGSATLEPVYCLGLCACGPAVQIDGQPHGRVDADRLAALMAEDRA